MKKTTLRNINAYEFDWLEYCTSCNIDCCHNVNSSIPKYECWKSRYEKRHITNNASSNLTDRIDNKPLIITSNGNTYDNRPIGCQIFPFDVMDVYGKLEWIRHDICYATPALDYEKQIDFFERQFAKKWSLEQIKQYVEQDKLNNPEKYASNKYIRIREVKWTDK